MDESLRAELERMREEDQAIREEGMAIAAEHGRDSPEFEAIVPRAREIDRRHVERLVGILEEHGWPGRSLVGEKAAGGAFLVLQHADLETQTRYLPLLRDATAAGDQDPSHLPYLEDRVRMAQGEKQLYGTQIARHPDGRVELWPVEDEEHLDERRAAAGLEPLARYLQRFGLGDPRRDVAGE